MKPSTIYFPSLNGLRAFAAFSVLIVHLCTATAVWFGYDDPQIAPFLQLPFLGATDAVTLFFVLSGFLITYLLLAEKVRGAIHVRAFYRRRVLRIWPLYYIVALLGLWIIPSFILPTQPAAPDKVFTLFFMTSIPFAFQFGHVLTAHLWSVSIEEQFYLIWPWLMRLRNVPATLVSVILIRWLVMIALTSMGFSLDDGVGRLVWLMRFDSMAIGGIGAYLVFTHHSALRLLYRRDVQAAALASVVGFILVKPEGMWASVIMSPVFMLVIVNVATNPRPLFSLETPLLNRLGTISYGLYMYHPAAIYVLRWLLVEQAGMHPASAGYQTLMVLGTLSLTLVVAALSYRYLESPLLRLKNRRAAGYVSSHDIREMPAVTADDVPPASVPHPT